MADHPLCPLLAHIAQQVDTLPHVDLMIYATGTDELELGLRRIPDGVHPCDAARDVRATDTWLAFGFAVSGWAHLLGEGGAPSSVRSIYLVDVNRHEISLLRTDERVSISGRRVLGRIPDACWRVMGLAAP
jgi:hypothetical protein